MRKAWNPPFIHGQCLDPDLCDVIAARSKSGEQRDERTPTDGGDKGSKTPPRHGCEKNKQQDRNSCPAGHKQSPLDPEIASNCWCRDLDQRRRTKSKVVGDLREKGNKEIKGCWWRRQRHQRVPMPLTERSKGADTVEGNKQDQSPNWRTKSKVDGWEKQCQVRRDWMNEIALPLFL